jgi:transcriptional regulator with XRE-family HTH domain
LRAITEMYTMLFTGLTSDGIGTAMETLITFFEDKFDNQEMLAEIIGVSQPTVSRWMNGKATPNKNQQEMLEFLKDRFEEMDSDYYELYKRALYFQTEFWRAIAFELDVGKFGFGQIDGEQKVTDHRKEQLKKDDLNNLEILEKSDQFFRGCISGFEGWGVFFQGEDCFKDLLLKLREELKEVKSAPLETKVEHLEIKTDEILEQNQEFRGRLKKLIDDGTQHLFDFEDLDMLKKTAILVLIKMEEDIDYVPDSLVG